MRKFVEAGIPANITICLIIVYPFSTFLQIAKAPFMTLAVATVAQLGLKFVFANVVEAESATDPSSALTI